ncbi:14212_t:CDS:2, partial [Gigaspora margarita]
NYLHLQVLKEIINLENGTNCFQNDNIYVVYKDKYEDKDNIVPNCKSDLYIFHSTRGYIPTCLVDLNTDFIKTIPPIGNHIKPIIKDIKLPIFAELLKNNIKTNEDAKLALNKFAKNMIENQYEEI